MTPLQFVSPREADSAEMYWMRKFGVASLLNTIKPKDARQKPWQWILRRSAWKPLSKETTVKCVKQQVHQLLHSRRHNLPLSEYLHLLTVARTVLPPTDFRNFFRKAEPKLLQRFKLQLPYSLPMKIPLLTREGKAAVHEVYNTVIPALTVPDPLRVYLQSAVSIVSQKTSTVGQLLCNQQYQCGTADVIAMAGAECHCSQRDPSLPRSRGHVYIPDFTVQYPGLTDVIPDMSVWHQNMKNASLPDWRTTSSSIFAGLYNAVKPLTSFDIPGSVLSKFAGTLTDTCVDQLVDRSRNADHRVQEKPLKHAARALKKHGFRAGVHDKANHCPWIACNALAVSLWVECFLSDPRKNEVFRASTQLAAQFVLYTHLMHSAAHAFTTHSKQRTLQWKTNPLYRSDTAQRLTELREKYSDMSRDFRSLWDKCLNPQRPLLSLSPSSFAEKYQKFDTPADVPSPTEAKHFPVPGCYDLQKFKSEVYHDQFKLREVVTHAKHPFRGANKRMGRVVSVVWSQAATALRSMGIISMNDVLPWVAVRWVQWFLDPIRIQARTATGVALEEERKDKKKVPLKIEQTAAAEWVKSEGWDTMCDHLEGEGLLQHVVDMGGVQVFWTDAFRQWGKSLLATSDVVWKSGPLQLPDMKILRTELKKMGEAHKACEMNVTLWAHLWIDHLLGWARRWGHIAIFAAFKGGGRHKALKCEISKRSFRGGSKGGRVSRLRGARVRVKGGKGDRTRKGWGEVIRSDNLHWRLYNKKCSVWESSWTKQRGYIENKGVFVQAEQGM